MHPQKKNGFQKVAKNLFLRLYVILLSLAAGLRSWAQPDDDDDFGGSRGGDALDDLDGYMDFQPIRFGIDDVVLVVLLLVACYVFGKIWKGCSYLILILAALFYYLTRY